MLVSPWPRASMARMPAEGRTLRISEATRAKERPEEPAPWCITNKGPDKFGGVRYA